MKVLFDKAPGGTALISGDSVPIVASLTALRSVFRGFCVDHARKACACSTQNPRLVGKGMKYDISFIS